MTGFHQECQTSGNQYQSLLIKLEITKDLSADTADFRPSADLSHWTALHRPQATWHWGPPWLLQLPESWGAWQ